MFPSVRDVETAFLLMRDYTRRFFPYIEYRRLLTQPDELDDIHGEVPETAKRWGEPIQVRAFVVAPEVTQPLTRYGMEEHRPAQILISSQDLVDAKLAEMEADRHTRAIAGVGDHFFYHGDEYEIDVFVPVARFANTDIVLYFTGTANRYRTSSAVTVGPTA